MQFFKLLERLVAFYLAAMLGNIVFSFVLLVIYFHPIPAAFYFFRDSDIEINFLTLGQSGIYSYTYIRIYQYNLRKILAGHIKPFLHSVLIGRLIMNSKFYTMAEISFSSLFYYRLNLEKSCRKSRDKYNFKYDINAFLSDMIYAESLNPHSNVHVMLLHLYFQKNLLNSNMMF